MGGARIGAARKFSLMLPHIIVDLRWVEPTTLAAERSALSNSPPPPLPHEQGQAEFFLQRLQHAPDHDVMQADFATESGEGTRYERIAAIGATTYYADWQEKEARLLGWSSEPLAEAMEFTGHGLADFWLESSEPDAAIFAYVSEVEADGTVRYVTERLLRALHRKESPAPDTYRTSWPFRSFRQEDIAPLVPSIARRCRMVGHRLIPAP